MTATIFPKTDLSVPSALLKGGIQKVLEATGRLPPISLLVTPLSGPSASIFLDRFLSYQFNSSILIPVDTFTFNFAAPDLDPFYDLVKDGDIATLAANDIPLSTGIIDMIDVEVDEGFGEKVMINGRDLMGQFEDNDAISISSDPLYANKYTVAQVAQKLIGNTRIKSYKLQDAPKGSYLFATQPGESKLAALQRFLEPLNCLAWMNSNGQIVIGRPNMAQSPSGTLFCMRDERRSNVLSMKVMRNSTNIANVILPIWSGQENVQSLAKSQAMYNAAPGPTRLRKRGHIVQKTVVVSTPQGSQPQDLSGINQVTIAGGSNLLQAHAKRELARQNQKEMIVQCVVPGHYNENGDPYKIDTVYRVQFDRGSVDENMYLFQVDYMGSEEGTKSALYFCRLGTIVSDVRAP